MSVRVLAVEVDGPFDLLDLSSLRRPVGWSSTTVVAVGPVAAGPGSVLALHPEACGLEPDDPAVIATVASLGGAFVREVLVVAPSGSALLGAAVAAGAATLEVAPAPEWRRGPLAEELRVWDAARSGSEVGVGPHPGPWPDDPRLDSHLLEVGDRRNVVDAYRYWSEAAIVADLDLRRHGVHVAVENWQHDLNIGTVVRNANAFNVAAVHVVGHRRWNRRGAMATDRYLHVRHHAEVDAFATWAAGEDLAIVGIDNVPGAIDLDAAPLPERCVLALGQEGPGLSAALLARCGEVRAIGQYGSTRSLNAGVASGIALHAWARTHAPAPPTWPEAGDLP